MSDMYHAAESGGEKIAFNKWESKSCPFYRDVLMSECYREGQLYCLNKQESFSSQVIIIACALFRP